MFEGGSKKGRQQKYSQVAAGQLVESKATRSNTAVPAPKVREKIPKIQRQGVFPDGHLSEWRTLERNRTVDGMVGGL